MKKERPISPHLTIYKPQISSSLSIMHRITGIILYIFSLTFSWLLIIEILGGSILTMLINIAYDCWLLQIVLFMLTMSLIYHLLNGIRHLFWDIGKGLEVRTMRKTGWSVVILSVILNIIFWCFIVIF